MRREVPMRSTVLTPLSKALSWQMRVLADLAFRWFTENGNAESSCAGARTRHNVLVIVAVGTRADWIEGELARAGLFEPQIDARAIEDTLPVLRVLH